MEKPEYQYPEPATRAQRQSKALQKIEEHRKFRKQMVKNILIAAVIAGVSFFSPFALVKIVLWLIAGANLAVGLLLYHYHLMTTDESQYLRVYPDRLEHRQTLGLSGGCLESVIYFEDVVMTKQDKLGRLEITLSPAGRSSFETEDKRGARSAYHPKESTAVLRFPEAAPKLKLIEDYWDKLHYEKKEYKKLDDTDDYWSEEDLEWDKLHRHGL